MPQIHITTFIAAPATVVFDLSRSVELHKTSMKRFREEAVAGTRFGLAEKDDTITWKAKHLFKTRILRVKITEMKKPGQFTDEQIKGDFREMKHEHYFKPCDNGTIMIDLFSYRVPYGFLGKLFDSVYLRRYIHRLLELRNTTIKDYAESGQWRTLLQQ
jgi:ligand-binding SRPBCC domain-containing protein